MKIKVLILVLCSIFLSEYIIAQTAPNKYWIQFTDKNNTPYSINSPTDYLSNRSIQRRINQGISVVENDLPIDPVYIDSLESIGLEVLTRSKWMNAVTVYTDSIELITQALSFSFVNNSQKVLTLTANQDYSSEFIAKPHELSIPLKSNLLDYGFALNQIQLLNLQILHNENYQGEGIQIAVLDAGYIGADTISAFDSLWMNNRILGFYDFVDLEDSVFADHNHGQMVLSCMGGNKPGEMVGTAPKASYWLLRTENGGSEFVIEEDNWVAAAEFADSVGADILNTSLGYTLFNDTTQDHTYADMDGNTARITIGSDIAASKGMLVVNSAGNSGNDPWHYIGAPADGDSVLAVGAVNEIGEYVTFSSTGPSSDGRVKPNVAAKGQDVAFISPGGGVTFGNGTSFASPILAGAAACLWQAHPQMTSMDLFNAIQESGSQYLNPDSLLGYGIPNFAQAHLILNNIEYTRFKEEAFFKASPNPFSSEIRLEMYSVDSQEVVVEMYNIHGTRVFSDSFEVYYPSYQSENLSGLETLTAGIYVVRITTKRDQYTIKVVKGK